MDQKRALIEGIRQLYPFVELRGRVSDFEMETVFPFLPPLEKAPVYDLAQLAVNRDRCCIVTHPGFFEGRAAAVQIALANNASLKPKSAPKPKKVVEEYMVYTAAFADKFNVDDIKHQLQIREVVWGVHCKKKAAFQQLWMENSELPDKRPVASSVILHDNRNNVRGGAAAPQPLIDLRVAQDALPPTPPRVGAAAADASGA